MDRNKPEYYFTDEFETCVIATKVALGLGTLNFQYGTFKELNETLTQWAITPQDMAGKYPMVWLQHPFTIKRGEQGYFGTLENGRVFIVNPAEKNTKAKQRVDNNFKPIIYPIYRQLLYEIDLSSVFATQGVENIKHNVTTRFAVEELNDVVDTLLITSLELKIYNKINCP